MIAVVQRVTAARVEVGGDVVGAIGVGLTVLAAVYESDQDSDAVWMAGKLVNLRVFRNGEKHFDLDVRQAGGAVLFVSNFTVAAQTRHVRRPSFDAAAKPEKGEALFQSLVESVRAAAVTVQTGRFGAEMLVTLSNDGPATFILDSRSDG